MIPTFKNEEEADKYYAELEKDNEIQPSADEPDITIIELEGERFEVIDTVSFEGRNYVALLPFDDSDDVQDNDNEEFTILEIIDDPDDEENCTLKTVDDGDLYDRIGEEFMKQFEMYDDEE